MEKRLGIIAIVVENANQVVYVNQLLSEAASLINARLGLPLRDKGISLISLVVEGDTDAIGGLTGKLGRLRGVKVKSVLTAFREDDHGQSGSGPGSD
ncbi:MAG: CopG family transcriptional regulator [Spirochaetes bacterium GWD1_61_31]|nr:MAG: CopG family transcriptional regulator [Spirochaetes bacterium GWB1_60_80]OHD34453.1 MAG: CopG family transcriptional regulator [Spirochaetes bacterium GWC1_61_12]OHD38613.1 MAG: CopG family transcriptional regulator [Spirochaetes bacterium GWD1_61_31]OHD43169.1 MAG: CopG family transcriptional regulator [Spirochaetes bacterium GWE1_60_18]OHD58744.1 MAG: CopG family transcriptional regulator [Spirochaetes bacterium GWF1_60_12]HAP43488.1 CopG family transcriptional regulator [Spirochaeta